MKKYECRNYREVETISDYLQCNGYVIIKIKDLTIFYKEE